MSRLHILLATLATLAFPSMALAASGDTVDTTNDSMSGTLLIDETDIEVVEDDTDIREEIREEREEQSMHIVVPATFELPALPAPRNNNALTRAELTAYIVQNLYSDIEIDHCFWNITSPLPPAFTLVYKDVHVDSPYAKYICIAMRDGLVRGFDDGTFMPNREVTLAEATKIISRAYALAPYGMLNEGTWYWPYLESLTVNNAIPDTFTSLKDTVSHTNLMEILNRIDNGITWLPSSNMQDLLPPPPAPVIRTAAVTKPTETTMEESQKDSEEVSSSSASMEEESDSSVSPSTGTPEEEADKPWWNPF